LVEKPGETTEIGRTDDVCPTCLEALARRPSRKTACPHCGGAIFVRTRPSDRRSVLVDDAGRRNIEAAHRARTWVNTPFSPEEAMAHIEALGRHREDTLRSARDLAASGVEATLTLLTAPHACAAAHAQVGKCYRPDDLPPLPLPGCELSPKCSCGYGAHISDAVVAEVDRRWEAVLAELSPGQAAQAKSMMDAALGGFGIEATIPATPFEAGETSAAGSETPPPAPRGWLARLRRVLRA
jgi:DNA-directed RNA polymerase subunit RPC12/RpoP